MGEPAKAVVQLKQRVVRVTPGEGGVELRPYGAQTVLYAKRPGERIAGTSVPDLDMELDKGLGGIVVRYKAEGERRTVLVPMAHVRSIELVE